MGLPWIRLDTSTFSHPKLLDLSENNAHRAIVLHLSAMCYAGLHGTDGYIPRSALRTLGGRVSDAEALVKVELWNVDADGWSVHGWDEYQVSDEESKARKEKARHAAAARWAKAAKR